jgi:hypothetical protein
MRVYHTELAYVFRRNAICDPAITSPKKIARLRAKARRTSSATRRVNYRPTVFATFVTSFSISGPNSRTSMIQPYSSSLSTACTTLS